MFISIGKKLWQLPVLGLASELGQGDSDPCLSGGLLYRICSVITIKNTRGWRDGSGGWSSSESVMYCNLCFMMSTPEGFLC